MSSLSDNQDRPAVKKAVACRPSFAELATKHTQPCLPTKAKRCGEMTSFSERQPDGGLLLAATNETFRIVNPAHLAAAHDIETALSPFNALPWIEKTRE